MQKELRKLIEMWIASGPNTSKMFRDNPGYLPQIGRGLYRPTTTGQIDFLYLPASKSRSSYTPKESALVLFFQLTVLSPCDKRRPDGPCACGCGQYFLKTTKHQKLFCNGHGSALYAKSAMKRVQAKRREPLVTAAKSAIRQFEKQRRRGDWKIWVSTQIPISPRTLGVWVEKGFLQAPNTKGRKS